MGRNGRSRGVRGLGVAVLGLLLVWPRLAVTAGFALSALATAGILLLAPVWRDALMRWTPRWVAEAVSVPLAAQVACTPVVAALSGQVSLVAVGANLLAAPAVAPATVLGLSGGLLGLVWVPLGVAVAAPAAWSAGWIIAVARWGAGIPTAAVDWGTGPVALGLLTVLCLLSVPLAPRVLGRPGSTLACTGLLVVVMLVRPPTPGWPPDGWVLAMCDVGQGDALVLRSGPASAVVVDAGPEPEATDACLDRLEVGSVPLLVLTHFHADHVGGVAGVLDGRDVDEVEGTALHEPGVGATEVGRAVGREPVPAAYGLTRRIGEVTLQTVWPRPGAGPTDPGESAPNNASVVLVAEVAGLRVLLTGDVEPSAQAALARDLSGLRVDVLKVPHHGSRHQDLDWLTSLRARLALVSVGEDNDYGHPAPDLLAALSATGASVWRTDVSGDVVVVVRDGELGVVARD
jgi:competence protein ComEC